MPRSIQYLLAAILAIAAMEPAQAEKVYDVIPYDGFTSGWSLGGTITTDGTIGTIEDRNIVDYSISVSYPGGGFTLTPGNSYGGVPVGHDPIIATASDLLLSPPSETLSPAQLLYFGYVNGEAIFFSGGFPLYPYRGYIVLENDQGGSEFSLPGFAQPFSIARASIVPEPSAALLLSFGCTAGALLHRRRRLRAC